MMRTGGCCFSIVRTCIGEVCVRSSKSPGWNAPGAGGSIYNVSIISRAGWFSGIFSASKL